MSINISGPVDANGNLRVNPPLIQVDAGFVTVQAEPDPGTITGTRLVRALDATDDFRLRVGTDVIAMQDVFIGAAINTALWLQASATSTITVAAGFLNLNAAGSLVANAVARVQSYRSFPLYTAFTTYIEFLAVYQTSNPVPVANTVTEIGVGFATGTAAPTDGCFFRWDATGAFAAIVNYNGTETQTVVASPSVSVVHDFLIGMSGTSVGFWIDGVLVAEMAASGSIAGSPTNNASPSVPVLQRTYNSAVAPSVAVTLKVAQVICSFGDEGASRPWDICMAGQGQSAVQGQTGSTMGSTANYANSAAPAAATLSNVAAGYTTFGGQFTFVAVAGAETDYAIFAFQLPAATAALAGKNMYITGVRISAFVAGAAIATTATVLQWSLGLGSTAVSLATAEGTGTKARRVLPLDIQSFPVGAAIGAVAPSINQTFSAKQFVEQGTFIHVILKMPIGTATPGQSIRGMVAIEGFFE